jgi:hypothetical protein
MHFAAYKHLKYGAQKRYDLMEDFKSLVDPARDVTGQSRLRSRKRVRSSSKGALDNDC